MVMRKLAFCLIFLFTVGLFLPSLSLAQEPIRGPVVSEPVRPHVFEKDLRTLPRPPITPLSETRLAPIGDGIPLPPGIVLPTPPPKGIPDQLYVPRTDGTQ